MSAVHCLALQEEVSIAATEGGGSLLRLGTARLPLATPGLVGAAHELRRKEGATEEALVALVLKRDGYPGLAALYELFADLLALRALRYQILVGESLVMVSEPVSTAFVMGVDELEGGRRVVLSRFALLRRLGSGLCLESPRSTARIVIHDTRAMALFWELRKPCRPRDLEVAGWAESTVDGILSLLAHSELLSPVGEDGRSLEDDDPALLTWDFHDLLFHARSRIGRSAEPYGGVFPHRGTIDPLPAVKSYAGRKTIPLSRPDLDRIERDDPRFSTVLEERRSLRDHGSPPLSEAELSEFLYRVARIRHVRGTMDGAEYETTDRVYPGGGAAYELEVYPVVHRCGGLDRGLYHYDPLDHRLARLGGPTPEVEVLLETAAHIARSELPQVLLVIAARFGRVSWKYSGMAYATILKDVGILMQTMYLVATAMDLAPCALGGGDADLFARAAGTNYYAESSVGELILGSRRPAGP